MNFVDFFIDRQNLDEFHPIPWRGWTMTVESLRKQIHSIDVIADIFSPIYYLVIWTNNREEITGFRHAPLNNKQAIYKLQCMQQWSSSMYKQSLYCGMWTKDVNKYWNILPFVYFQIVHVMLSFFFMLRHSISVWWGKWEINKYWNCFSFSYII